MRCEITETNPCFVPNRQPVGLEHFLLRQKAHGYIQMLMYETDIVSIQRGGGVYVYTALVTSARMSLVGIKRFEAVTSFTHNIRRDC